MAFNYSEFSINLLVTLCSPLLSHVWLLAVITATASFLIMITVFKSPFKTAIVSALLVLGTAIVVIPQQSRDDLPKERRADSGPPSTGVYGAPGSTTQDVLIDASRFKGCDSGLENHGAMTNIIIRNSSFDCPAKLGAPVAAPPSTPRAAPSKAGELSEPSKPRVTSGLYNPPGAVTYDAAIDNVRSVGCENGLGDIPSNSIRDNVLVPLHRGFDGFKVNGGLGGPRARPESQCCARGPGSAL
jgi:hypothetical protein